MYIGKQPVVIAARGDFPSSNALSLELWPMLSVLWLHVFQVNSLCIGPNRLSTESKASMSLGRQYTSEVVGARLTLQHTFVSSAGEEWQQSYRTDTTMHHSFFFEEVVQRLVQVQLCNFSVGQAGKHWRNRIVTNVHSVAFLLEGTSPPT